MPLVSVIAGRYSATRDGKNLGILSSAGFELSWSPHYRMVGRTDSYAESLVNGIYTGADWRLRFQCLEWPTGAADKGGADAAWPWDWRNNAPHLWGVAHGKTGRSLRANAKDLVLSATTSTPAAALPATLTSAHSVASNASGVIGLNPSVRTIPVELILLPYGVDGNTKIVWFTVT